MAKVVDVYLEIGEKRVFAGAMAWPGWCRAGKDEDSAVANLLEYGPRYARVMKSARLTFAVPETAQVVEHVKGDATTDFGAPGTPPKYDDGDVSKAELETLTKAVKGCWKAFDAAVAKAHGKTLRKGPRGGGRTVDKIVEHVLGAEQGYVRQLGRKVEPGPKSSEQERTRKAVLDGLTAAAHGATPKEGPRGGKYWTARYFARRLAWHALDHAWEIEDRLT